MLEIKGAIMPTEKFVSDKDQRKYWMAILAEARTEDLDTFWNKLRYQPKYRHLKPPEMGMIMLRGRTGGTGLKFNFGEVTITRCTVQLEEGTVGLAYVLGRNPRHAELAALFDALLQDHHWHTSLMEELIRPIASSIEERKNKIARKVVATKVEFFTMVRGEE